MKIQFDSTRETGRWMGFAVLAIGILIGLVINDVVESGLAKARPAARALVGTTKLESYLQRKGADAVSDPGAEVANGLETLRIELSPEAATILQKVRNQAMDRGVIIQDEADTVGGQVGIGDTLGRADLRIKGDWTDHVDTDKWSLRIKLKDTKLNGMSVFSIQHPKTRGMLWEWLVLAAARRDGMLAPRSTFVNVVLNGNPMGVYYLEEHFSKELLESQGRREGPIVLWDESTRWASLLQVHNVGIKGINLPVPNNASRVWGSDPAEVRAYGEKRLSSIESLSRSLYSGVEQMLDLQALVIADASVEPRMTRLNAIARLQGKTIDSLVDTEKLAQMHALISLFQIEHSLIWHNMRFYHDPVLDRLEPILFDCNAHQPSTRDIAPLRPTTTTEQFAKSTTYYNGVFEALGKYCEPTYLDELFEELGEDLARFESALDAEFSLPANGTVAGMLQRLRTEQAYIHNVIEPVDPVNFHASYSVQEDGLSGMISSELIVDAWSTTKTPVVIEGFEFSNGAMVPARGMAGETGLELATTPEGGVVLPSDGRPVRLSFPMDSRLANLGNIDQFLTAIKAGDTAQALDLNISAVFRPIATSKLRRESLTFRMIEPSWRETEGRPMPPSLEEALAKHSFLDYEPELDKLSIRGGNHKVTGDLVVPSGYTLHARNAGLLFEEDAVLLSDAPLEFHHVILRPQVRFDRWRGVIVLQAKGRTIWDHVTIVATDSLARAGWTVTGGITFYRSPVTMTDCHIQGTWAEDGTNIFGADFLMERTLFTACVSDSFDGDFVTGTLKDCTFKDGFADGVDVSGSDITVVDCKFLNMGDKGISAGENSVVRVQGGLCDQVSLGIAAKDRSRVIADGMQIRGARMYALTAFIKKAEFGPAHMEVTNISIEGSGRGDFLVQTDCTLQVDGVLIPTQDLDVKQLYEDKVLGQ